MHEGRLSKDSKQVYMNSGETFEVRKALPPSLHEDPDVVYVYSSTPWWSVLHYVVQVGAVIVMEISLQSVHVPCATDKIVNDAKKKMLQWLQAMSRTNVPAFRAWIALISLLGHALCRTGEDVVALLAFLPDNTLLPIPKEATVPSTPYPADSSPFRPATVGIQPHDLYS